MYSLRYLYKLVWLVSEPFTDQTTFRSLPWLTSSAFTGLVEPKWSPEEWSFCRLSGWMHKGHEQWSRSQLQFSAKSPTWIFGIEPFIIVAAELREDDNGDKGERVEKRTRGTFNMMMSFCKFFVFPIFPSGSQAFPFCSIWSIMIRSGRKLSTCQTILTLIFSAEKKFKKKSQIIHHEETIPGRCHC